MWIEFWVLNKVYRRKYNHDQGLTKSWKLKVGNGVPKVGNAAKYWEIKSWKRGIISGFCMKITLVRLYRHSEFSMISLTL